jgi:hypothetical protein
MATVPDPYTGLALPLPVDRAEVVVQEGLPVFKTLDWVDLSFEPEIVVPADAWADWDAAAQQFITVAEMVGLPAMAEDPGSIVDIAVADGRFTTLVAALTAADLAGTLAGPEGHSRSLHPPMMPLLHYLKALLKVCWKIFRHLRIFFCITS